jgi:3-methyladenine DNA glycosylase AlkD
MSSSARPSDGAARSVVIAELWAAADPARLAGMARVGIRTDAELAAFLPVIERESPDGRNAVKKSVSWALRQIGKRDAALHRRAVSTAKRLRTSDAAARPTVTAARGPSMRAGRAWSVRGGGDPAAGVRR